MHKVNFIQIARKKNHFSQSSRKWAHFYIMCAKEDPMVQMHTFNTEVSSRQKALIPFELIFQRESGHWMQSENVRSLD